MHYNPSEYQNTILDSINEGVFTIDTRWRIVAFNRAAELITGITRSDAVGRPCHEVFCASICESDCALQQTSRTGRPVVNATAYIVNRAGRRVPIRLSTALLRDDSGTVIGGVETFQDLTPVEQLRKELESRYTFEDIISRSPQMRELFSIVPHIAESESTVLIEGESGTGKELFARAVHNLSHRKKGPFVVMNCAAFPDTLLESELFGYKAGAFTGAGRDKPGRISMAEGGTLFLDEIGDISPAMQVRLLRVLQDRCVEPLGSLKPVPVDVRIVAATNKSLSRLVKARKFRQDLFYRIRVVYLKLPGLRERREDIPLLINHLISRFNHLHGKSIAGVSDEVLARLMEHDYPGNVRELENIIEQAFVLCRSGLIELHHLPHELRPAGLSLQKSAGGPMTLRSMERLLISEALHRYGGSRKRAAAALGINPSTLYRKCRSLAIEPPEKDGRKRRP